MGGYRLHLDPGIELVLPMTYTRNGVPTQVDSIKAQIRSGPLKTDSLVLDLASKFTQSTPGALTMTLTEDDTEALYGRTDLWWDCFGSVAGKQVRLVDTSPVTAKTHTSVLT